MLLFLLFWYFDCSLICCLLAVCNSSFVMLMWTYTIAMVFSHSFAYPEFNIGMAGAFARSPAIATTLYLRSILCFALLLCRFWACLVETWAPKSVLTLAQALTLRVRPSHNLMQWWWFTLTNLFLVFLTPIVIRPGWEVKGKRNSFSHFCGRK